MGSNGGCDGGTINGALNWNKQNLGMCSECSFPYIASDDDGDALRKRKYPCIICAKSSSGFAHVN